MSATPRPSLRRALGAACNVLGIAGLPLALGAAIGFYVADRGVPWLPTMLEWLLATAICSVAALLLGHGLRDKLRPAGEARAQFTLRKRAIIGLALLALLCIVRLGAYAMRGQCRLTELPRAQFDTNYALDVARLQGYQRSVAGFVDRLAEETWHRPGETERVLTAEEETRLLDTWRALYESSFAVDQLRVFYEDWYRFDPSRNGRSYHIRSFLLHYAADLMLFESSQRASTLIARNANAVKFLDAPHATHGLGAHAFTKLRDQLHGSDNELRLVSAHQYLAWLEEAMQAEQEIARARLGPLRQDIERHLAALRDHGLGRRLQNSIAAEWGLLQSKVRHAWYPTQAGVAEWMGDTKVRRVGTYLVDEAQQVQLARQLQPGDILLARKNWYMSNIGLPGFWPHAILYLGPAAELDSYFDDPAVKSWVKTSWGPESPPAATLSQYLAHRFPSAYRSYQTPAGEATRVVIEAISEGVSFNPLKAVTGDYVAGLRPRLDKLAKAKALTAAFSHFAKPYDFNFDFATDHALVCTELVWRAYRPDTDKQGLKIPLRRLAGRSTLPANEIAGLYVSERGQADAQLEFIQFFDGREKQGRAIAASEADFAASYRRPRWDIVLD